MRGVAVEFEFPVLREEKGEEVEYVLSVRGSYTPETRGRTSGHPDTWYPGEGGEAEIESALSPKGVDFDPDLLTPAERATILDQIRIAGEDNLRDGYERHCEGLADAHDDRMSDRDW